METIRNILNDPSLSGKLTIALESSVIILIFSAIFLFLYHRYFWKYSEARRLFWIFTSVFIPVVVIKFLIGFFYKGYIPELLFFYAIPSPKVLGLGWLILAAVIPVLFLYFKEKIEKLPTIKFLLSLFLAFFAFSVSVAAIRDGLASVADPFTRTYWEYTGFLPQIQDIKSFLSDYISIVANNELPVAQHSTTHPPGYTAVLYFLNRLFGVDYLGLSLWVVVLCGLLLGARFFFFLQFFFFI